MSQKIQSLLCTKFESNWLPWITLRHLLPAAHIREVCATMVHEMSAGSLSLRDIVEEHLGNGDIETEIWVIRPKICSTRLQSYLLRFVRQIVWKDDQLIQFSDAEVAGESAISPAALEFAFNLGSADFVHSLEPLSPDGYVQLELKALFDAFTFCGSRLNISSPSEVSDMIMSVTSILVDINLPLRLAIMKHLGDLYCDRDHWLVAAELYKQIKIELSNLCESNHTPFILTMKTLLDQSLAACAAVNDGYDHAQSILATLLNDAKGNQPLVTANAALDEYVSRARSQESLLPDDTRSATLLPPLLADSHTIENALRSWEEKDFEGAVSWFWSVLRRQISLGQLAASKYTKTLFATCLIDELCSRKSYGGEAFKLAIELIIEGENSHRAKHITWTDEFIDSAVDLKICQAVIDHAEAHDNTCKHRRAVAVVLFSEWTRKISADRTEHATVMLQYLIYIGSNLDANLVQDGADFKTCFSAVLDVCVQRPEFRSGISSELTEVLARRIGSSGYWTGDDVALRLAAECADTFNSTQLKRVVQATLALLEQNHSSQDMWVIVKPAIRFLGENSVASLIKADRELAKEVLENMLKFSSQESGGTYAADIIFSINHYSQEFLHSLEVETQYRSVINQSIEKASHINSSSAVNNIMALLVSPKASGRGAISEVLQILQKIVDSAVGGKAALSFGAAYTPLRYLVAHRAEICKNSEMLSSDLDNSLNQLCERLQMVWQVATIHPDIFSPLALLRRPGADRNTVHNWAIASLELAEVVGQLHKMNTILDAAREQSQLSDGISLGFATRHAGGADSGLDSTSMDTESRGAFYSAIGRRLSALQNSEDRVFMAKLLKNTLRHGPRQVDVAVFASISPQFIEDISSFKLILEDYEARIGNDRELSLILGPLVQRWILASELN